MAISSLPFIYTFFLSKAVVIFQLKDFLYIYNTWLGNYQRPITKLYPQFKFCHLLLLLLLLFVVVVVAVDVANVQTNSITQIKYSANHHHKEQQNKTQVIKVRIKRKTD